MKRYFYGKRTSVYMIIASLLLTTSMMHPGVGALIVLALNTLLLIALRWVCHREGDVF